MTTRRLDLRGLECPEPTILAVREFGRLEAGDWLEAEMDSEACAFTVAEVINRSRLGAATVERVRDDLYLVRAVRLR